MDREANVSKALREYGRRNRLLEDAVQLMSSKVSSFLYVISCTSYVQYLLV